MHYYRFHIGDYRSATAYLSNEEDLAYRRLLDMYYDTEQPIPLDTRWVARRLRVAVDVVEIVLNDFFVLEEAGWRHSVCDEQILKYQDDAEKNKVNGKKGGRPKKGESTQQEEKPEGFQSQPSGVPDASQNDQMETQNNPVGFQSVPNGNPVESQSQPNGNPEKSLTNNHITNNQEKDKAANTNESISRETHSPPPDRPIPRTVELATLLRKHGAAVTHANPPLIEWAERGVTDKQALMALDLARRRREEAGSLQPVNAGFLDSILWGEVLKPKTEKPKTKTMRGSHDQHSVEEPA